ncbi:cyclin-dependent kinase 2-interacting protein [Nelusetta ayraudi]|uniref:cyclin-dependent kinase 2-interacting protein n=1 Tax=Nelusetta ayraudi TaxID=303726 RepID=UPI003F6E5E80
MDGRLADVAATSVNRKCPALTGSARKLKDNAADWHNLLLRWEKLNEEGFVLAGNIVNMRQPLSQDAQQLLADGSALSPWQQTGVAVELLQAECCKLQEVVDRMVAVVTKMQRLMTSQRGVEELEAFQCRAAGRTVPLFHGWSTKDFGDSCGLLLESFSQEVSLRQLILQEVAHTQDPDLSLVYLSCWLHQPFTCPQTRLSLEALLLETGHRPL